MTIEEAREAVKAELVRTGYDLNDVTFNEIELAAKALLEAENSKAT